MKNNIILKFILEACKPFKWLIAIELILTLIWAVDLSLRPYLLKLIIDRLPLLNTENIVSQLSGLIGFYLFMSFLVVLIWRLLDFTGIKLNAPLRKHIANILMNRMMQHSQNLFQNHFAGSLANKIKDVMGNVYELIWLTISQFICHILAMIIAIFTVYTISYKFAVLLTIWICIFIITAVYFSKNARLLSKNTSEIYSKITGYIVDILTKYY